MIYDYIEYLLSVFIFLFHDSIFSQYYDLFFLIQHTIRYFYLYLFIIFMILYLANIIIFFMILYLANIKTTRNKHFYYNIFTSLNQLLIYFYLEIFLTTSNSKSLSFRKSPQLVSFLFLKDYHFRTFSTNSRSVP